MDDRQLLCREWTFLRPRRIIFEQAAPFNFDGLPWQWWERLERLEFKWIVFTDEIIGHIIEFLGERYDHHTLWLRVEFM